MIAFNFRSDRMREIAMALGFEDFDGFERRATPLPEIVTMTQYRADFPFAIAYPPIELDGLFPEVVAAAGLRQERVAETEKYRPRHLLLLRRPRRRSSPANRAS